MPPTVAEIVRFALIPGADPTEFVAAAQAVNSWLQTRPGWQARCLSQGADGTWCDHVLWADMASAEQTAAAMMSEPALGPFMALIDPASIQMEHHMIRA
jgi:hypothetical protein